MRSLACTLTMAALSLAAVGEAKAQETVDLTVRGALVSQPCTVSLQNGGAIDVGTVMGANLSQTVSTVVGTFTMATTVVCPTPTRVAIALTDNREASGEVPSGFHLASYYSLGTTRTGKEIGLYQITVPNTATADGASTTVLTTSRLDSSPVWGSTSAPWDKQNDITNTDLPHYKTFGTVAGVPEPFMTASFTLSIMVGIYSRNHLQLVGVETIDGSTTMELIYL